MDKEQQERIETTQHRNDSELGAARPASPIRPSGQTALGIGAVIALGIGFVAMVVAGTSGLRAKVGEPLPPTVEDPASMVAPADGHTRDWRETKGTTESHRRDSEIRAMGPALPAWLGGQTVAIIGAVLTVGVGIAAMILATTSAFRTEMGALRTAMGTLRTELRAEMDALRTELKSDIKGIDARLRSVEIDVSAIRATLAALGVLAPEPRTPEDAAGTDATPGGDTRD